MKDPEDYVQPMLERVKKEYIQKTYGIMEWTDHEDFLTQFAKRSGKLSKVSKLPRFLSELQLYVAVERKRFFSCPHIDRSGAYCFTSVHLPVC